MIVSIPPLTSLGPLGNSFAIKISLAILGVANLTQCCPELTVAEKQRQAEKARAHSVRAWIGCASMRSHLEKLKLFLRSRRWSIV